MKRSTAVKRLAEIVDGLERVKLWDEPIIVGCYVFGGLVETNGDVERVQLALVVDETPEDVPWMSRPLRLEALASMLRFDKLPVSWSWRPREWPVWNHEITRAVCVWSATAGTQHDVLAALTAANLDQLEFVGPADDTQLAAQVGIERETGRRHLEATVAGFYDREWQREHKGGGIYPEDHLWWASAAYLELDDAADGTVTPPCA